MARTLSAYPEFVGDTIKLDQAIGRIAQALLEYRAEFLFGAGMSRPCNIPCGYDLSVKLLSGFFPPNAAPPDEAEARRRWGIDRILEAVEKVDEATAPGVKARLRDAIGDVVSELVSEMDQTNMRPSGSRLLKLAGEFPLEAIAEAIENMPGLGRKDLTTKLEAALFENVTQVTKSKGHELFLSICYWDRKPTLKRIFTTNFDNVLEDALQGKGQGITVSNYPKLRDAERDGKIPIIHLHATLDDEKNYQITETNIFDTSYRATTGLFRAALAEADAFVFVGYSMGDPDFRTLYMHFREEIRIRDPGKGREDKTTYLVGPVKDRFSYALAAY
jgi:hypothetical protein